MFRLTLIVAVMLAASPAKADDFNKRIDRILNDSCLKGASVCMIVKSIVTGKSLYSKNPDRLMVPASNMKIVTSAAALGILKPSFTFKTTLLYTGVRDGDTIKGDLVVKGGGDPHLVSEDLWLIVNELQNRGIRRITGGLILDDSYFDGEQFPPTWKPSTSRRAFEAPTGALALNFNSVTINIYPDEKGTKKPHASLSPQTSYFTLVNKMRSTKFRNSKITIDLKPGNPQGEKIVLGGTVRAGHKEKTYYRSVANPLVYFGLTFIDFAKKAGVTFGGGLIYTKQDGDKSERQKLPMRELYVHTSRPLYQQLMDMNQYSNNFMAEQIIKTIGAETVGPPGRFKDGLSKVRDYLVSQGFSPDLFRLADGSGLSRKNGASCSLIVGLLERLYSQWEGGPEFITSLARMGREGSVEDRLTSTVKAVRVKTGNFNGVSALSGYYPLDSGGIIGFSMIHNNLSCSNGAVWGIQDRILMEFERVND